MVFRSKYGAQIIMTPTYIMPPKPTCKVVKREGQRGARIDPKGCKVRTTKDTQGNKRQYNKRGEEKITLKTTGNEMRLVVAGANKSSPSAVAIQIEKVAFAPGEARRDLTEAKNRISKKFHTRGAFPENYRFPVILGLVDAADCSHCMHSFQSPIGTHSQRGDN